MVDEVKSEETMSRNELAEYLHGLAEEFEGGEAIDVNVGNKTVTLSPRERIDCEIGTHERSAMLGSDTEALTLDVSWEPGN
ncbi:amphi-Trp domain-containing protein [Halobacteriales archaeon QS_8_65_32]|jgi:amphi-Trp domain-containing protein|nr:MAG: amphi-Trp domain-containing protein [Halobacteriales archaeon QS_8_65_32]